MKFPQLGVTSAGPANNSAMLNLKHYQKRDAIVNVDSEDSDQDCLAESQAL